MMKGLGLGFGDTREDARRCSAEGEVGLFWAGLSYWDYYCCPG